MMTFGKSRYSQGFTIVELLVAITLITIVGVSVTSFAANQLRFYAQSDSRNVLSANVQQQLSTIGDDIRSSDGVALYNDADDGNAPRALVYPNTIGPNTQPNFWRSADNQLILTQTPSDSSNKPIYDDPTTGSGRKDLIIYYIRDSSVYRRVVPAPYVNNKLRLNSCASNYREGGCLGDRKVLSNLKDASSGFKLTYLNAGGSEISTSGGYNTITSAAGIKVNITAAVSKAGQALSVADSGTTMFRKQQVFNEPRGIVAGNGGLYFFTATVKGLNVATSGCAHISGSTRVGTAAEPVYLTAGNTPYDPSGNIYSNSSGTVGCNGSEPLYLFTSTVYGNACLKGQTTTNFPGNGYILPGDVGTPYTRGLMIGCIPQQITPPSYNKPAFTSRVGQVRANGDTRCTIFTGNRIDLLPGRYNGSYDQFGCVATLKGDLYFTGDFSMSGVAQLVVDENLRTRPTIVVNGKIDIFTTKIIPNTHGIAPYFVSFNSTDNRCSTSDTCTSIDANKRASSAGTDAISISGASEAPKTQFNAVFGKVDIFTTSITTGAISGQTIRISGASTVVKDD